MRLASFLAAGAAALAAVAALPGCAVTRDQETIGAYAADATITAGIKARLAASKAVDASAIGVETLHGEVVLTGFAKSPDEKDTAGSIAANARGVKAVRNQIVVGG
jgi:hyperosmotically inducible protein